MKVSPSSLRRFRGTVLAALFAAALVPSAARAETFCALFFDLGNTLLDQSGSSPWPLFPDAQATIDELQARGIALGSSPTCRRAGTARTSRR